MNVLLLRFVFCCYLHTNLQGNNTVTVIVQRWSTHVAAAAVAAAFCTRRAGNVPN